MSVVFDKTPFGSFFGALLFQVILCLLACTTSLSAQEGVAIPFDGTQAFSKLMHLKRLAPLASVGELRKVKPSETLIVVFGSTDVLDAIRRQIGSLASFQRDGGAILIASDRPSQRRLEEFGITIDGAVVHEQGIWAYKQRENCPFVRRTRGANRDHPIFTGVGDPLFNRSVGIATNSPSFLRYRNTSLTILGELSDACHLENRPGLPINSAFMMGTPAWDDDRVLMLASHSVFMNGMLGQGDNDNLRFAGNCIDWLRQRPDGSARRYVFFAEDGNIADDLNVPLSVPLPPPKNPVEIVNNLIKNLEDDNAFYRFIYGDERWSGLVTPEQVLRVAILGLSLLLLIYGAHRLIKGLHRIDTAVPLPQAWSEEKLADPALIVQRHRDVRQLGNYQEAAQHLTRQFFAPFLSGVSFEAERPPEIPVRGSWWTRRRMRSIVGQLWRLACGQQMNVSGPQLRHAVRQMDQLARHIN